MAKVDLAVAGAGRRTFELSGTTVKDILDNLGAFPAFSRNLLGATVGNPFGDVFLNGVNVQELPLGQETQVGDDDLIRVAPEFGVGDSGFLTPQLPELSLDSATLNITLSSPRHTVSDVAWLVNSIDNMAMACVWGAMHYQGLDDSTLRWARNAVRETVSSSPQAQARFYPNLPESLLRSSDTDEHLVPRRFYPDLDPIDPLDVGVQTGLNTMLRRILLDDDRERYEQLFSFAEVRRLEHHSPLLLETAAIIGGAIALPAVLLYGCMKAVYFGRRSEAETGMREVELEMKKEELRQSQIRTQIQQHLAAAILETKFTTGPINVPDTVMAETARIAATTVADIGSSPLIGSVTLGLSKGK